LQEKALDRSILLEEQVKTYKAVIHEKENSLKLQRQLSNEVNFPVQQQIVVQPVR